ncbi:FMN reductase [Microbacterium allomyrinae]|uniref:FMN reductase n=1 Tax=Microbacterium allomyrinae TaxID=2830666 RepID=A0A9X1S3H9_9MICO|nr:FMN reductase [Microbacterium allomyrinae]MCC2033731.1 FMN reductase [Microbacterium allomyrinae]
MSVVLPNDRPLRVVGVSGSLHEPSRTTALVRTILERIGERVPAETTLIEVAALGPSFAGALRRDEVAPEVEQALQTIESADLIVAASPVYRASFTGLFKHLFDFVGQYELVGTPVLVAATGGGERHALILEHQLRPLFGFFQALTLPIGVYASNSDFTDYELTSPDVVRRVGQAVDRSLPLIEQASAIRSSEYVATW